jgi:hypothetical protein
MFTLTLTSPLPALLDKQGRGGDKQPIPRNAPQARDVGISDIGTALGLSTLF